MAATPAAGITAAEVEAGIEVARHDMVAQIVVPVWRRLDSPDRECLVLAAASGGTATPGHLHEHMGRWRAAESVDSLTRAGVVESDGRRVRFVHRVFRDWVMQRRDLHGDLHAGLRASSKKDVALAALRADDRASYEEISRRTGIDRAYVGRIARQAGLSLNPPAR